MPALLIVAFLSLRFAGTNKSEAHEARQALVLDSLHESGKQSKHFTVAQRIDALYKDYNKYKGYNCAVLVAKGDDILLARGYGYADYGKKKPLDAHTSFRLASVSKPITATAALMLFDDGKLDLQKPVSDYLPGFPYEKITVEMLLCHRSGLPNYMYFVGDYLKGRKIKVLSNDDVLNMIVRHKPSLTFKPGRRFQYSNTNYALLVNIIEKQSGMPFGKFLQENIFTPMQMRDSYLLTDNACTDNVACAYTYGYERINDDYLDGVVGDKGICCSVTDLYKFHLGLERNLLLKPETKDMAYTPRSFEKKGARNYGYGWRMKKQDNGTNVIFHNGWWHGFNNVYYRRPADSTVVIVLSNKLNMGVYKIDKLLGILDGKEQSWDTEESEIAAKPVRQKQSLKKTAKKSTAKSTAKKATAKTSSSKKTASTKSSSTKAKETTGTKKT